MSCALAGKRIVNTRAVHQADELNVALCASGAIPISYPCIAIELPDDCTELNQALGDLTEGSYDWLLLSSVNTVFALERLGTDLAGHQGFSVGVVGPATKIATERLLGLRVQTMPAVQTGAGLAAAIPDAHGKRFLLPGSDIARPELVELLSGRGGNVTTVRAYRTVLGYGGDDLPLMLRRGDPIHSIAFTSPSTVNGLITRLRNEDCWSEAILDIAAACIGSSTEEVARARGFRHVIASTEASVPSLVSLLSSIRSTL